MDIEDDGIRPILLDRCNADCQKCLDVCPGIHTVTRDTENWNGNEGIKEFKKWGNFIDVWEGYASDPAVRLKGSSGGLCTALSIFCLEREVASGVLHIGSDEAIPWKNRTYFSTKIEDLLKRAGSRYSPASPCDGLRLIEDSNKHGVFIGKPCDIAALRMAQQVKPNLKKNTALAIGFFCAGTPSTKGTLDLFKEYGADPEKIREFYYRGEGWPGRTAAWLKDTGERCLNLSYQESWGFVQKYRPFRCYICPDLTAEFADISVGDPWYRDAREDEPGRSLILVRTRRGREIFHQAIKDGYVIAKPIFPQIIHQSQSNLLGKRRAIWGRLMAMKLLGIPYPRLDGFHLFDNWRDLSLKEKAKSILGTARRIIQRNYFKPLDYAAFSANLSSHPGSPLSRVSQREIGEPHNFSKNR